MRGWSARSVPKTEPVGGVPGGLGHSLTHDRRRSEDAVEPGVVDHLDDGAHPPALLADQLAAPLRQLDLAGGVRPVAELVLQPLDLDRIAGSSSSHRGTRKQLMPPGACASIKNASDMGAEQNHLWPVSR